MKCKKFKEVYFMAKSETDNAAAEARRAYRREWAKKNPDKIKAAQERYWKKKAAQIQEQQEAQA